MKNAPPKDFSCRNAVKVFLSSYEETKREIRRLEERLQEQKILLRKKLEAQLKNSQEEYFQEEQRAITRHHERLRELEQHEEGEISKAALEKDKLNREARHMRNESFSQMKRAHKLLQRVGLGHLIPLFGARH